MRSLTFTVDANQTLTEDHGQPMGIDGFGFLAIVVTGSTLGGGTAKLQFSPNDGTTWIDMQGLAALALGDCKTVSWCGSQFRIALSGSTSPSFTIWYDRARTV